MFKELGDSGNKCVYPKGCAVSTLFTKVEENGKVVDMLLEQISRLNDPDVEEINIQAIRILEAEDRDLYKQIRSIACSICPHTW